MGFPNLVCPFDQALIARLTDRVIVPRVTDPSLIVDAVGLVRASTNRLSTLILDTGLPVAEIPFSKEWEGVALAVFAPSMGNFRGVARHIELIRRLDPTIYLPVDSGENLSALRVLSSVDVRCAAVFTGPGPVDWEGLSDLMTYAILGTVPHASIEPFAYISARYRAAGWVRWGSVFFDDPQDFFHLDREGRVALSARELAEGAFIEEDVERLDDIASYPAYRQRIGVPKDIFLDYHPCSRCPGWRLCLGRFAIGSEAPEGCASFFSEMIDLLQQYRGRQKQSKKELNDNRHL